MAWRQDPSRTAHLRLVGRDMLAEHAGLKGEALDLAAGAGTPEELLDALCAAGCWREAGAALCFMVTSRAAVWYACLLARLTEAAGAKPSQARRCAEAWVRDQDDALAYRAYELAEDEQMEGPGAWAGLAAYWAGPSLAPPDMEPVRPAGHLAPLAARTALLLAHSALKHELTFEPLVRIGGEIATGQSGDAALREAVEKVSNGVQVDPAVI